MLKEDLEGYLVALSPSREDASPCVIVMSGEHEEALSSRIISTVREGAGDVSLCFVTVPDWNGCLSPWEERGTRQSFAGCATETLRFIENVLRGYLYDRLGKVPLMIAGYSLAGLFSLWAYLESDLFCAAASCSGSLWFPGFEEKVNGTSLREGSIIYLSLGGKEPASPDPLMATVGDVHERLYRHFRSDPAVKACRYDKNPGGHFKDPDIRLAKGIVWMVENVI